jgi:hypothetical protein
MSLTIRGGVSPVVVETDADGNMLVNTPLDVDKPGFVATASEVDPGNAGASIARTVRPDDTSADFRKRVGMDTPQWYKVFTGIIPNTISFQQNLTTMTVAQSGGFIRLNAGNSVTSGHAANLYSYRFFSQQLTMPVYFECDLKYVGNALESGVTVEFGMINGPTGVTEPTDGAFFRYLGSALLAILSYGGAVSEVSAVVDPSLVPEVNQAAYYQILFYTQFVEYWINNVLVARIERPASNGTPTLSPSQQVAFRIRNGVGVANAVQLHIASVGVDLGDALSGQTMGEWSVGNEGGSWQTQDGVAVAQTTLWANSAAPSAGTLSNTALPAAAYNKIGGLFDYNAPAGAVTDYIAFAYQVPAGSNALPGKNLWIKEVSISLYNDGAAVATTPTQVLWAMGVGSTALSLATGDAVTTRSPKRIPLGNHTLQLGAVIGEGAKEGTIVKGFVDGVMVEPGTFLHFIIRVPVGTATASQRLRGLISATGDFRLWATARSPSATSAPGTASETRDHGTRASSPPTEDRSPRSSPAASSARPIAS